MGTDLGMAAHEHPGECLIELLDVESLEVEVLVDNVTDSLSINPDTVRSEMACLLQAGMFKWRGSSRGFQLPTGRIVPFRDIPQPDALTAKGGSVMYTSQPRLLLDRYFAFSGEISRVTTYEQGFPNHVGKGDGKWEPDPLIPDEQFLAARVKDKGLVVFTACSHAGVVNVLKHARALFPSSPVYALVGSFHLSGAGPEQIIPDTVRDLHAFELKTIVPGHCTGWRALAAPVHTFGEGVVQPSAVGKQYRF